MLPDIDQIIAHQQEGKTLMEIARELNRPYGEVAVAVLAWLAKDRSNG